jgi:aquaporin Z
MRKYFAELLGTFAMVFSGTGSIIINEVSNGTIGHLGIAVTFGLIVMVMIYSIGNISGAHINPAVSIGFTIAKKFPVKDLIPYIISQLLGALLASIILKFLFPENLSLGTTTPAGSEMQSFVLEIILTFFLMFVIMSVSQGSKETGMFAGIAIGSTIMIDALFAGPITGASMNPARSLAPALISGNLTHIWIYIAAPVIGATLAVFVWKFFHTDARASQ